MPSPATACRTPSAWRHLPNAISVLRMVLVLPIALCIHTGQVRLALWLALAAGVSDAVDGWLARHFHWRSRLGGVLDPAADKLLLVTCFVLFSLDGPVPWWLTGLVLGRDVVIAAGALAWHHLIGDFQARPSWISKTCTFMQIVYVLAVLVHASDLQVMPLRLLGWLVVVLVLASGVDYVVRWGRMARHELARLRKSSRRENNDES